jgi:hypothetical protein
LIGLSGLLGTEFGFLIGIYGGLAVGLLRLFGVHVGFSPWYAWQLGSRLVMVLGFGFLADQLGFMVGPLVCAEVGLRHLGQQLGSGLGFTVVKQ